MYSLGVNALCLLRKIFWPDRAQPQERMSFKWSRRSSKLVSMLLSLQSLFLNELLLLSELVGRRSYFGIYISWEKFHIYVTNQVGEQLWMLVNNDGWHSFFFFLQSFVRNNVSLTCSKSLSWVGLLGKNVIGKTSKHHFFFSFDTCFSTHNFDEVRRLLPSLSVSLLTLKFFERISAIN